ncbi:MAG: hypothetical protein OEZ23_00410, partial [Gammaproteobacteria bacterium]|nr:hypothetical protein [Gammaproteobacteria bacterium]
MSISYVIRFSYQSVKWFGPMGWLLLLVFSLLTVPAHSDGGIAAAESAMPQTCSYNTYEWNTRLKKAVNYRRVEHPYTQISGE